MELLIGLAIVLAMSEWREYRAKQGVKRLAAEINRQKRVIDKLLERQSKLHMLVQESSEASHQACKQAIEAKSALFENQDKLATIHSNVETILKEYEINGIPLGYQRKTYDIVEGL